MSDKANQDEREASLVPDVAVPLWLRLQCRIDFALYCLEALCGSFSASPLDQMVDLATGLEASRRDQIGFVVRRLIRCWRLWERETGRDMRDSIEGAERILGALSAT